MASSIVTSIDSLIMAAEERTLTSHYLRLNRLMFGLWSLKVYVVCLRKFGNNALLGSSSSQSPFFSRIQEIEDRIGGILKQLQSHTEDDDEDDDKDDREDGSEDDREDVSEDDREDVREDDDEDGSEDDREDGSEDDREDVREDDDEDGSEDDREDDDEDGREDDDEDGSEDDDEKLCESFDRASQELHYLVKEIDERYTVMSNHTDTGQSSSLTPDEITVITDSILKIIDRLTMYNDIVLAVAAKAFGEQLTILKNFLLFTLQTSVEKKRLQNLLIHFEAVAINAAQAFINVEYYYDFLINVGYESDDQDFSDKMIIQYSLLAPKVKPFNSQLSLAYTEALSSSRFSTRFQAPTQDMDDHTIIKLKNFLHSLISLFWDDLLLPDACQLDCMKDQLQMLYEGLRLCRTILKQQPKHIDRKVLVQIGVLVCEAGILICSCHQTINAAIHPGLSDLLERIKVIQAHVEKKTPRTSGFSFPVTQELGHVDSMLENMMELTCSNGQPIAEILPQTMQEQLVFLKSFLQEPMGLLNQPAELQSLWNSALKVVYRVQFLIDRLVFEGISNSFSNLFDSITEDIRGIKNGAKKISFGGSKDIKVQKIMGTVSNQLPLSTPSTATVVVGFHSEAISTVNQLTRGSKQLRMVLMCGMGGVGKTTLAFQVYNDTRVTHHFHARAWCSVSQVLDKKKVLLELLNQIHPGEYWKMTENDLMENLYRTLKIKRYLIFLDDVWNIEVWNSLKGSFPDDNTESRILLTSRHYNIAPPEMCDKTELVPLNFQDSLTLLQMKLFGGREGWPPTLVELGKQIAEKCKGLPLTIVIVAGLLAKMKQESWEDILEALSSATESRTEVTEQCMISLDLSYKCLPDYLKPCLLYFGAFPEDQEVSVKKLILLWIAEGFIRKTNPKRIEDVAKLYITELIERSLVMVTKNGCIDGAKTCRVHDVIHDFCVRRAKQESFYQVVQGHDQLLDFNEPCYLQRLFIHSELVDFTESKLFCPRARSLLFVSSRSDFSVLYFFNLIILRFKLLKVLDFGKFYLDNCFPSEIGLLIQLKYLSIQGNIPGNIPPSIGNLFNLETLILDSGSLSIAVLPPSIFNLQKLKYLQIGFGGFYLEDLENSPCLLGLETCSWAITKCDEMKEVVKKFPNIRRLKLEILLESFGLKTIQGKLESLAIIGSKRNVAFSWECGLSANLRKVKLMRMKLSRRDISIIGRLPNLQVLKLGGVFLSHNTLEMDEGEFLQLRYFKLAYSPIVRWIACDELPNLQRLVLQSCGRLEEIPTYLESIPTLEEIDVFYCSRKVVNSVKHIGGEQMELGNQIKIRIKQW